MPRKPSAIKKTKSKKKLIKKEGFNKKEKIKRQKKPYRFFYCHKEKKEITSN